MIDTRHNLLTTMLIGLVVLALLIGLILFVALGRVDVDRIAPMGEVRLERVEVAVPESGLEAFDEYGEIVRRPVFFSDRRLPVVELVEVEEEPEPEPEEEIEEEPVPDLKARVAGIIITPEMRMAMINDQEANRTLVMREGMSLEGEQAGWRLDRIESRKVDFVSADGQRTGLELEVNTRGLSRPSAAQRAVAEGRAEPQADEGEPADPELDADARSRAEEIRRRVAERRAELRAEAERRAQEQQDNQ